MVRRSLVGQTMVEFALVAPVLLLLIGATLDMGRGVLLANLLAGASREAARMAALEANSGSNTAAPACTALATPCSATSVVQAAHLLDSLGVTVVYQDSSAINAAPPGYGTYNPYLADPTQPGTITLAGGTNPNTIYVFVYEYDPTVGNATTRWSCPSCAPASGAAVRLGGNQRVVVDLKLKWQPVMARFLGIPAVVTLDSQTVDRIEF